MVLMIKGNTETNVDELLVEEYAEKGFRVVESKKDVEEPKKTSPAKK